MSEIVYVVTEYDNENAYIRGVFSALDVARAFLDDNCFITVHIVDEPETTPEYAGPWDVELAEGGQLVHGANTGDGACRDLISSSTSEQPSAELWWYPRSSLTKLRGSPVPKTVPDKIATINVWAITRREAIVAAKIHRQQMIQEDIWVWPPSGSPSEKQPVT